MIRFVPLTPELFWLIPMTADFALAKAVLQPGLLNAMCVAPHVASAMLENGKVLGAGGVYRIGDGRGLAWMMPGEWMTVRHFVRAAAECRRQLKLLLREDLRRIECTVLSENATRARFAHRLGFRVEGRMRRFGPDGQDHDLWAVVARDYREQGSHFERAA